MKALHADAKGLRAPGFRGDAGHLAPRSREFGALRAEAPRRREIGRFQLEDPRRETFLLGRKPSILTSGRNRSTLTLGVTGPLSSRTSIGFFGFAARFFTGVPLIIVGLSGIALGVVTLGIGGLHFASPPTAPLAPAILKTGALLTAGGIAALYAGWRILRGL